MRVIKSLLLTTTLLVSALDAATRTFEDAADTADDSAVSQRSERVTPDQDNPNPDGDFDIWFSRALQSLKRPVPNYSSHSIIQSSPEGKNLARSYINRVSGWDSLERAAGACAIMWGFILYSYYSQYNGKLELWESKGPKNSEKTGYPEVFPPLFAITAGLTVGTFNFALNYYNRGWLTAKEYIASYIPYLTIFAAFVLSCWMYSYDIHHYILPTPYAILGGLCLSLLYDYYKQSTITTLPNPLKIISLNNKVKLNGTIDLIATLIAKNSWRVDKTKTEDTLFNEITKYLYRTN